MFFESKKNLAVLVTEKNSKYAGRLGKIRKFSLDGAIVIQFSDNKEVPFYNSNGKKPVKLFYRHYNPKGISLDELQCGPRSLAQQYRELGGQISEFIDDYIRLFGQRPEKVG